MSLQEATKSRDRGNTAGKVNVGHVEEMSLLDRIGIWIDRSGPRKYATSAESKIPSTPNWTAQFKSTASNVEEAVPLGTWPSTSAQEGHMKIPLVWARRTIAITITLSQSYIAVEYD